LPENSTDIRCFAILLSKGKFCVYLHTYTHYTARESCGCRSWNIIDCYSQNAEFTESGKVSPSDGRQVVAL